MLGLFSQPWEIQSGQVRSITKGAFNIHQCSAQILDDINVWLISSIYPPYSDHGIFFAIWVLVVHVLHPYVDDIIHINLSSQGLPRFWPLPMHDDPLRHSSCVRERFTRIFQTHSLARQCWVLKRIAVFDSSKYQHILAIWSWGMTFKHIFFCGIVGSRCRLSFVFGSEV